MNNLLLPRPPRAGIFAGLLFLVLPGASPALSGENSGYFPDHGRAALHQRALDLKTPATVMMLAGEPGEEDLATLTTLRMQSGARVVVVFLTNGEGTLADDREDIPSVTAGRRKEEAYQALSLAGCESFFINSPSVNLGSAGEGAADFWAQDSLKGLLAPAISRFKPDVVLIPRPLRESDSARTNFLERISLSGSGGAAPGKSSPAWTVHRIFLQVDSPEEATPVNAARLHPLWKRTFLDISRQATDLYTSLRLRLHRRAEQPVHWYRQILPTRGRAPATILGGEPELSSDLQWVNKAIEPAIRQTGKNERKYGLVAVAEALARIEKLLVSKGDRLSAREGRILARWKEGLEDFRCTLDDVSADIRPSDSIMADRQLFFLRVGTVHFPVPAKETEIIFPLATDTSWGVNESRRNFFPVNSAAEFRVLTPGKLPFNYPPSLSGLGSSEMRIRFPYFIVHKDADRAHNFAYRREVLLKGGPGRAVEVLTPMVRLTPGEEVRFQLYNITRQGMKSEVYVRDSVVADSRMTVVLERKDEITLNRLPLNWQVGTHPGDHIAELRIGKQSLGRFLVRSFECRVDSSVKVGLLSGIPDGTIQSSLHRLHIPWVSLDTAAWRAGAQDSCTAIILDRNVLALRPEVDGMTGDLRKWVSRGGHLIVLPQHGFAGDTLQAFPEFRFEDDRTSAHDTVEMCDVRFASKPNALDTSDWENWIVSRSEDRIVLRAGGEAEVVARTKDRQKALLLRIPFGGGRMTLVTLDLVHQLETVHPGACRVFVNILSN